LLWNGITLIDDLDIAGERKRMTQYLRALTINDHPVHTPIGSEKSPSGKTTDKERKRKKALADRIRKAEEKKKKDEEKMVKDKEMTEGEKEKKRYKDEKNRENYRTRTANENNPDVTTDDVSVLDMPDEDRKKAVKRKIYERRPTKTNKKPRTNDIKPPIPPKRIPVPDPILIQFHNPINGLDEMLTQDAIDLIEELIAKCVSYFKPTYKAMYDTGTPLEEIFAFEGLSFTFIPTPSICIQPRDVPINLIAPLSLRAKVLLDHNLQVNPQAYKIHARDDYTDVYGFAYSIRDNPFTDIEEFMTYERKIELDRAYQRCLRYLNPQQLELLHTDPDICLQDIYAREHIHLNLIDTNDIFHFAFDENGDDDN